MSSKVFGCPECQQPFQVDSSDGGQRVRCPSCEAVVQIPLGPEETIEPPSTTALRPPELPVNDEVPEAFLCPFCKSTFGVLPSMYGTAVGCPHCDQPVLIERETPTHAAANSAPDVPPITDQQVFKTSNALESTKAFGLKPRDQLSTSKPNDGASVNESAEIAAAETGADSRTDSTESADSVAVFTPQCVDHLLPTRFATLDPAFFYRRKSSTDQVLLPLPGGGVKAVSSRRVTVVHNGKEYELISSARYRRNLDIIVNAILVLIATILVLAIGWAVA